MSGGVVFSPARGPAGAAGAAGAPGPPGPAGTAPPTSLSSLWAEEPGVYGTSGTPFVLADWQDVSTVAPNTAGATAVTPVLKRGLIQASIPMLGVARFGAFNFDVNNVADGEDVCMRFAVELNINLGGITSSVSAQILAGFFETAGADTKFVGAGFTRTSAPLSSVTMGRYACAVNLSSAANLGADSAATSGNEHLKYLDIRARRVGIHTRLWMAFGGGVWFPADSGSNATTVNLGLGTARAGIRIATSTATVQSATVTLIRFGRFPGGLPSDISVG